MKQPPFVLGLVLYAVLGTVAGSEGEPERPLLSFAVLSDVQYADKKTVGSREYRRSLEKLKECVRTLNGSKLAFAIQLGDLIDGGEENLDRILPVYNRIRAQRRHVLGNHDFCIRRGNLLRRLGLSNAYYDFARHGWRFVVLDGMDISLTGGWRPDSPNYRNAVDLLTELKRAGRKNAFDWNGGIGAKQKRWLERVLQEAAATGEHVVLFCHFPILEAASSAYHLLWNHEEVRHVLESSGAVVAYFSGHDHRGGYAIHDGIHHVTVQGIVESGNDNAYALVDVHGERLEVKGTGKVPGRTLWITTREEP